MAESAVAVGFETKGDPEVLGVYDAPDVAAPGEREVTVRVAAAGVHPADLALRSGFRPIAGDPPYIPGMAFSGVVESVGEGSVWQVGDRVIGMALPSGPYGGAYKARIGAPDDTLARVPDEVELRAAAVLPMNGHTALQAVRELGSIDGATIAVTGAAGALGALVIPLAVAAGAHVIGVARAADESAVRALGAQEFIATDGDIAQEIVALAGGPVVGIIDLAVLDEKIMPALRGGGTLVTLRGWADDNGDVRVVPASVPAEWHRGQQLETVLKAPFTDRPVRMFPPADAAEAHRVVGGGGLREGVVIDFT